MKNLLMVGVLSATIIFSCGHKKEDAITHQDTKSDNEIHFITKDSIKIYGDLYEISKSSPTLLIFHQGGSNTRAEYKSIIPKLQDQGFNILTIDQRVGGQYFYGGYNRTVAEIAKNEYHYCDAYPDMEATLEYAKTLGLNGNIILWGSSYSATLSLQLGTEYKDDIDGVLAFSPASGPAMKECQPDSYIESIKLPLLIMKPASEMESERSQNQMTLAKEHGHQFFIAQNGVHGSSMLDEGRIEGSAAETWNIVNTFLSQFK